MEQIFSGSITYNQTGTFTVNRSNFEYLIFNVTNGTNTRSVIIPTTTSTFQTGGIAHDASSATLYSNVVSVSVTDTSFTVNSSTEISLLGGTSANVRTSNSTNNKVLSVIGVQVPQN